MDYGYCSTTLVPCRAEPSEKSEQTNQLLFGEPFEILEKQEKWCRIRTLLDDYTAWIDAKLCTPLASGQPPVFEPGKMRIISSPLFKIKDQQRNQYLSLTFGSILPAVENNVFTIGRDSYALSSELPGIPSPSDIPSVAAEFLNAPYLWGGKSLFGIDCSGLVQVVFRICGIWLPRDAWQQASVGQVVDIGQSQAGDLGFFKNAEGRITHVGILCGNRQIIHASGRCRIDIIDAEGIRNTETDLYSHQLSHITRIHA